MNEGKYRALIVEDDDKIVEVVTDYLESLGHYYDRAATQTEARQLLAACKYCYVLLDLEIPVRAKRMARVEHGINLLEEIRRQTETCRTQVIIMTSHGTDGPYLAVDMMKKGADDYICKPFPSGPDGRTLGNVIKEALQRGCKHAPAHCPVLAGSSSEPETEAPVSSELTPFQGGRLVFYQDRVELLGHVILTERGNELSRKLLELLAKQRPDGKFVAYSGIALAQKIAPDKGQNDIAGYVKYIRDQIQRVLQKAGISCGRQDVIESGGRGYRFNAWITIEGLDT